MKKTILLALFVLMGVGLVSAQTKVTGKVTSADDGQPLPYVTIVVKGTSALATSGVDGKYTITLPEGHDVLTFSFSGMQTEDVKIGGRSIVDVAMIVEAAELETAVIVGYGTQSTKRVTTAIASVKADALKDVPVASMEQALQGKMSGVHVAATSGRPGSPVMMAIRGRSSISAGNTPLYVIDGVPLFADKDDRSFSGGGEGYSLLANLNMEDVESIDVLKDAAAAAIYGSRGSNGVVLITTKKGKLREHRNINFSSYVGFQSIIKKKDLLNASDYRQMVNEANINAGLAAPYTAAQVANPEYNTDWMDKILASNSYVQNYQVSASGGTNATSYYTSLGYFKQDGLLLKGSFDRYSARLNVDHKYSDLLKLGVNMGLSRTNRAETAIDNSIYSPWSRALMARPDEPVYGADGKFFDGSYNNPVKMFLPEYKLKISNVISNFFAEVAPVKGLTYRSALGVDFSLLEQHDFFSSQTYNGKGSNGEAQAAANRRLNWVATQTLQYKNSFFSKKLFFDATAVYEYSESERDQMLIQGQNFPSDQIKYLTAAAKVLAGENRWTGSRLESYLGRINLSWSSKYLLGFSVRADGSSKFPKAGRWGYFPSISGGWNIDEESFMKNSTTFSTAKIRASFGRTGNQQGILDFRYLRTFSSSGTYPPSYNENPGFYLYGLGSPDLTWETTDQIDLGFDLGFLKDRLTLQFDLYQKNTKDLLISKPIPATTGFSTRTENVGEIEGKGMDITLRSINFRGEFNWTTSFTISFYKNKVTKLHNDQPINGDYVTRHAVGQPLGSFYLIKALGVDPNTGDMIYEDISGPNKVPDGKITSDDRQFVGSPFPKSQGGLNNSLSWKGFDFDVFFQYSFGQKIYKMYEDGTGGAASLGAAPVPVNVFKDIYKDRWTTPGQVTGTPRPLMNDAYNTQRSSRFLEYGDFIRLKSLTLGYNLPTNVTSKLKVQGVRVYVSAQNLFTITNYSGFDPEISTDLSIENYGVDQGAIPQMKTIMFGINLNF